MRSLEAERSTMEFELDWEQRLEAESIHLIREVAAEFERPAILFRAAKTRS